MIALSSKKGQVTFVFEQPKVKTVYLAGDFNGWSPTQKRMVKSKSGQFRATVKLPPGTYQYKFVADGVWMEDPTAEKVENEFGTANSVITIK